MLATEHIDIYTQYSIPMWEKYCKMHGYNFFHYSEKILEDMAFTWSRIQMMIDHQKKSSADYIMMVDADTLIYHNMYDLQVSEIVNRHMKPGQQILFQKDGSDRFGLYFSHNFKLSYDLKRWVLPNAGFNIMANTEEVRNFLQTWIDLGRGRLKHIADIHPRTQNVLIRGVLQDPELDKLVGYLPSKLVSKRNTKFVQHLSAMSKEKIASRIKAEFDKTF
ncbi:galactosyl transferase GMA12/MNN10 family protein [Marinoscillum furvescens DSM 4134]|uniref:Galactosyl transferase GMA12/MNN10 family protein n=2 Tax=Marinoscillum furvescens TaxID=1026 RepID=A0A3D9L4Z9_MARFU|nr:galactosyl transferase GMA12/MNN10 family protein [Marinoscillum furvescens DSM 4134]